MITIKTRATHPTPPPPRTPDGQPYKYEMIHDGGHRRSYANTLTELCAALIENYNPHQPNNQHLTPTQRDSHINREHDQLRILYAVKVQTWLQALINTQHNLNQLTPHQQATLRSPRTTQPAIEQWNAPTPLVLSAHEYQPHGPHTKPHGNIIWINPRDEQTLLTTLHKTGWIHLNETVSANRHTPQ